MSLKAIEMQIALPRTHEAGKLQEQLQQRGQLQTDVAAERIQREEIRKRTTVTKGNQKDPAHFDQNDGRKRNQEQPQTNKRKQQESQKEHHPYKGNFFDTSG